MIRNQKLLLGSETKLSVEEVWNTIRDVKFNSNNIDILSKVAAVERKFQVESSEIRSQNADIELLKLASDMFVYLAIVMEDDARKSWLSFYFNLFKSKTANEIILTLNRITKRFTERDIYVDVNQKLFDRITTLLSLHYKEVQSMMMNTNAENTSIVSQKQNSFVASGKYFQVIFNL